MTGTEYQKLALRTCNIANDKNEMVVHGVCGLASEAGEVASIIQKRFQGHKFDRVHMLRELGDCLWMVAEICEALGSTMDEVMEMNIGKLKARYPNGFEAERSLNRAEGDI